MPFPEAKIKYRIRKKKNTPNNHKAFSPLTPMSIINMRIQLESQAEISILIILIKGPRKLGKGEISENKPLSVSKNMP